MLINYVQLLNVSTLTYFHENSKWMQKLYDASELVRKEK